MTAEIMQTNKYLSILQYLPLLITWYVFTGTHYNAGNGIINQYLCSEDWHSFNFCRL